MKNIVAYLIPFIYCIGLLSCKENKKNELFFGHMKENYANLDYEKNKAYLNGFGFSKSEVKINGKMYNKLKCDPESIFYLAGYVRYENRKVLLLPLDSLGNAHFTEETKIFDFNAKKGEHWEVCLNPKGKYNNCLTVISFGQSNIDSSLYIYKLIPYHYNSIGPMSSRELLGYQHIIEVSKNEGIRKISTIQDAFKDTMIICTLYPKVKMIFNGWETRLL